MPGIYIHIPFCAVKCPYCDFYSLPARPARMDAYLAALLSEISTAPDGLTADTVYFGGGTPVLFGEKRLAAVLAALERKFSFSSSCEITLEANPFTLPLSLYRKLFEAGFNRISFGMQSAVPKDLRALGRLQGPEQMERAVESARQAGFSNLSADLMLGIPHQNMESLQTSIRFIETLELQHLSAYLLKIEEGTAFARSKPDCPDEDAVCDLYLSAVEQLESLGLHQYEISNFAKPGFESRHNLKYWRREEYLGFGPAAHSFYKGVRTAHPRDLDGYIRTGGQDRFVTDPGDSPAAEELMLRLRLREGADVSAIAPEQAEAVFRRAAPLQKAGLLTQQGGRIALTPKGFLVSNAIIAELTLPLDRG